MSTRAQVRFATREDGVSFSEHPDKIHAQFYVHHDGYPEGLGLDIAEMVDSCKHVGAWELEHVQDIHTDLDYIYYIWSKYDDDTWISIFKIDSYNNSCDKCGTFLSVCDDVDECIFVGTPESLIKKYKLNTNEDG